MKQLTIGLDSNLGNYKILCEKLLRMDCDSPAMKFLDSKIAESPNGEKEEVITDEGQMVWLLMQLNKRVEGDE